MVELSVIGQVLTKKTLVKQKFTQFLLFALINSLALLHGFQSLRT